MAIAIPMAFYSHASSLGQSVAGLWACGGNLRVGNSILAIISTEPNELMRPIHRRMPVILQQDDETKWLDCSPNSFSGAQSLLKPFPAQLMAAHEVSKRMNNPKYDAPDCSAPVEG